MSSPQVENGYTKIANELLEALAGIRISGEARQCLDVIIRKTYGFNKKEDRIALSQFCLLTKMPRPEVCRALRKLAKMNLIIGKNANADGKIWLINKGFDTWKPLAKKPHSGKNANGHWQKRQSPSVAKMPHTKETSNTKETITKERGNLTMKEFLENEENQKRLIEVLKAKGLEENLIICELRKFISYWTERNKSGKKERWELEPVFELNRRLTTWFGNYQKFNRSNKSKTINAY